MGNAPGDAKVEILSRGKDRNLREYNPLEHLPREGAWVRRLARSLLVDEARTNDLVQYVFTEALQKKPRPFRPWAALVLRRAAKQMRLSEWRRRRRELAAAKDERQVPSHPIAERADTLARLAALVREMEEPYRTAMLLHFFETSPTPKSPRA